MKRVMLTALVTMVSCSVSNAVKPNGLVILLTDFGADSIHVGAMKGAIYSKFPQARIDSITNSVTPYDVVSGAYMLLETCGDYPPGTTFVCVVDPRAGTPHKAIALETKDGRRYVGPDNGLLSLVADKYGVADIRECSNPKLWRAGAMSHMFHGRDILGPVAAALASGLPMNQVGRELDSLTKLDVQPGEIVGDTLRGAVIRVDDYGNMVTNIPGDFLTKINVRPGDKLDVTIGKAHFVAPLVRSYSDVRKGQLLVDVQSAGFIECAINHDSLVIDTGEGVKAKVTITKRKESSAMN